MLSVGSAPTDRAHYGRQFEVAEDEPANHGRIPVPDVKPEGAKTVTPMSWTGVRIASPRA